jgi:hypothetical protein
VAYKKGETYLRQILNLILVIDGLKAQDSQLTDRGNIGFNGCFEKLLATVIITSPIDINQFRHSHDDGRPQTVCHYQML